MKRCPNETFGYQPSMIKIEGRVPLWACVAPVSDWLGKLQR
jgi:hypothetical protein